LVKEAEEQGEEEREKGLPGTALSVRMLPQFAPESVIIEAPWETEVVSFEVFLSHDRIEPGLTISEQKLISLPSLDYDAIWVELKSRLIAKNGAPSRSPYLRKTARKLV
jgi:hypothetical protein